MRTIHEWTAAEIRNHGMTAFEFFDACYKALYGHSCKDNRVSNDSQKYHQKGFVTHDMEYVWDAFEEYKKATRPPLPARAVWR